MTTAEPLLLISGLALCLIGYSFGMVDVKKRSVLFYVLELAAGIAIIFGSIMLIANLIAIFTEQRVNVLVLVLSVVLIGGGIFVFKRPGR